MAIYIVRCDDKWGDGVAVDGLRYRCMEAFDKKDLMTYLRGCKSVSTQRIRVSDDFVHIVQSCGQEVRKLVFDGATCVADLDRMAPGWRERERVDRLTR